MDDCVRETCTNTHTFATMPTFMYICMSMTYFLKLEIMLFIMRFKGLREWDKKTISTVPERYDLEAW